MDDAFWISLGAIAFLLVLSGLFSGSETALTAASRPRLHRLEQHGSHRARIVNRLREQQERLIGAILLGNNMVNILASALATGLLIGLFGEAGILYATLAMTLLVLIFGEVLPKSYALRNAERLALAIGPFLRPVVFVLAPITLAIQAIVRGTLRLFGVRIGGEQHAVATEEDLRGTIDLHAQADADVHHERAMLHSVLDLADVEVGEIMVHRQDAATINADEPPDAIVEAVLASPYTRIPLWRGKADDIVGVLHAKALLRQMRAPGDDIGSLDIVSIAAEPWFVPESTTLLDQLQAFRDRREHFALVVDEYGALMGIVTLEDILEEIVGDIADEHDIQVSGVRAQPDGSLIVRGTVTIRDLNRQFDWDLPDEEAATIAGLIMHEARRIPEPEQVFEFYGFRFEILRRQRNQITAIRLARTPEAREDASAAP